MNRRAFSLLELLVVLSILAILIGLLLPAIQRVRESAELLRSKNKFKQVMLAQHNFSANHNGEITLYYPADNAPYLVLELLPPYLDYPGYLTPRETRKAGLPPVFIHQYVLGTDPSILKNESGSIFHSFRDIQKQLPSSMAVNYAIFSSGKPNLPGSFQDGTSHTIGLGEKYYTTYSRNNNHSYEGLGNSNLPSPFRPPGAGLRSASFADTEWLDIVPVQNPTTGRTEASVPGKTFQVRPELRDSDGRMLQAMQPAGLIVAMFDGSVRVIAPSVSEHVFWGMVTPAGGEIDG